MDTMIGPKVSFAQTFHCRILSLIMFQTYYISAVNACQVNSWCHVCTFLSMWMKYTTMNDNFFSSLCTLRLPSTFLILHTVWDRPGMSTSMVWKHDTLWNHVDCSSMIHILQLQLQSLSYCVGVHFFARVSVNKFSDSKADCYASPGLSSLPHCSYSSLL